MTAEQTTNSVSPEQKRFRIALSCLILGLVCVLWAWASWIYRASAESDRPDSPQGSGMTIQHGNDASVTRSPHIESGCANEFLLFRPTAHHAEAPAKSPLKATERFAGIAKPTHDA